MPHQNVIKDKLLENQIVPQSIPHTAKCMKWLISSDSKIFYSHEHMLYLFKTSELNARLVNS